MSRFGYWLTIPESRSAVDNVEISINMRWKKKSTSDP